MSGVIGLGRENTGSRNVIYSLSRNARAVSGGRMPMRLDAFSDLFNTEPGQRAYRTALVDVWGVLTDGRQAFAGASAVLAGLRRRGVQVILVSNTSRRADDLGELLEAQGIPRGAYDAIITGGELAFLRLSAGTLPEAPGARRCMVIGDQPGGHWAHAAGLECVETVAEADLLLGVGVLGPVQDEASRPETVIDTQLTQKLASAVACGRVLVLTNADQSVRIGKTRFAGIGVLAGLYADLGGRVVIYGKPQRDIYETALALAGQAEAASAVMVGDTLATDIAGAQESGIDTVLITGAGSHATSLHPADSGLCSQALARLIDETGTKPDYVMEAFR